MPPAKIALFSGKNSIRASEYAEFENSDLETVSGARYKSVFMSAKINHGTRG